MKLSPIFCDNAVFAENKPVRVFGEGDGEITVEFAGAAVKTTACGGKWSAELPPVKAGGPFSLTVTSGSETETLNNVYVGRVYLLIGQSNAEFRLTESNTPEELYKTDPLFRGYFVKRPWITPDVMPEKWAEAEADNVGAWSAIAYLTGKKVREEKGGAVGFISCFQGASIIESWLPADKAEKFALPPEQLHIDHTFPEYTAWNRGGVIYEKMLSPLFPFSLSGVVWYQGESDTTTGEAKIYKDELECLISTVREKTNDPDLPFVIVQIADFDPRRDEGWRAIQDAQIKAAGEIPGCAAVVSSDVCETDAIHPPTKTLLSERIASALIRLTDQPGGQAARFAFRKA